MDKRLELLEIIVKQQHEDIERIKKILDNKRFLPPHAYRCRGCQNRTCSCGGADIGMF